MLTNRQYQILKELENTTEEYYKGVRLTAIVGCSLKTLQNEMKELKLQLQNVDALIESYPSKGYKLQRNDELSYQRWKASELEEQEKMNNFQDPNMRVSYILMKLLAHDEYCKSEVLADEMYLSRSRISIDLRNVKKILKIYDLSIEQKPNYGIRVVGLEKNKRLCIVKEQLPLNEWRNLHAHGDDKKQMISFISDIIVATLMSSHYKVSDIVFQNLVLHVYVAINRMLEDDYVDVDHSFTALINHAHEVEIAHKILKQLQERWNFEIRDSEIQHLAINLLGKRSYEFDEIITAQMDTIVNDIMELIRSKIGMDFSGDVELRISLALHFIPLISRVRFNMQMKNSMVSEIKQHFTLAYDMATLAASYLSNVNGIQLSEDEIAYLAVHFNLSLQKKTSKVNPKKVLIICNSRRGDSLMIQHTILKWFDEMISQLDIINAVEVPLYDINKYDCIFATFLNHENIPKQAKRINFFLDERDRSRIERALKGESEVQEVLKYFHEELFMNKVKVTDKDALILQMCELANTANTFHEPLYDAVMRREKLGYTAFGGGIAVPHPDGLMSDKTSVVCAITKKPIAWGPQKVQLIFLICVEKGNQRDLRALFECISLLMANPNTIDAITAKQDFHFLLENLHKLMK